LENFGKDTFKVCYKHLSNTSTYFQQGDIGWDSPSTPGGGFVNNYAREFNNFFAPSCVSNVEAILCHAAFRECREVEDDLWVPSLMCRSECENQNLIWNACLKELESKPDEKKAFDDAIMQLVRVLLVFCPSFYISAPLDETSACSFRNFYYFERALNSDMDLCRKSRPTR
jgi:hypothetical protein